VIEVTGLQPGEKPIVLIIGDGLTGSYREESTTFQEVGADGRFQHTFDFRSWPSVEGYVFKGQLIHQHGVACFDIELPPTLSLANYSPNETSYAPGCLGLPGTEILPWFFAPPPAECPFAEPITVTAVAQTFEQGLIIGIEADRLVYVFHNTGVYRLFSLTEEMDTSFPAAIFDTIWAEPAADNQMVAEWLGDELAEPLSYQAWQQYDSYDTRPVTGPRYVLLPSNFYISAADGRVISYQNNQWHWAGTVSPDFASLRPKTLLGDSP
jgi:hypothetical protein